MWHAIAILAWVPWPDWPGLASHGENVKTISLLFSLSLSVSFSPNTHTNSKKASFGLSPEEAPLLSLSLFLFFSKPKRPMADKKAVASLLPR